jgi:hypothetical protein
LDKDQALAETQRKEPVTPAQGVAEQEESGAADKGADSEEPETSAGSSEEGVLVEEGSIESSEEPDEEPREERRLIFPLSFPVALTELRESIPFLLDHKLNAEVVLADTTYNGEVSIRELERLAIELRRNKIKVIAHLPHHESLVHASRFSTAASAITFVPTRPTGGSSSALQVSRIWLPVLGRKRSSSRWRTLGNRTRR